MNDETLDDDEPQFTDRFGNKKCTVTYLESGDFDVNGHVCPQVHNAIKVAVDADDKINPICGRKAGTFQPPLGLDDMSPDRWTVCDEGGEEEASVHLMKRFAITVIENGEGGWRASWGDSPKFVVHNDSPFDAVIGVKEMLSERIDELLQEDALQGELLN